MLETILSMFGWEPDPPKTSTKNVYAPTVVNVNAGGAKQEKPTFHFCPNCHNFLVGYADISHSQQLFLQPVQTK